MTSERVHVAVVLWGEAEDGLPFSQVKLGVSGTDAISKAQRWADGNLVVPEDSEVYYVGVV